MAAGAFGHMSAQDKQKKAEELINDAKESYDSTKSRLERDVDNAKNSISSLQREKKYVLGHSMKLFLKSYEKIKNILFKDSLGIDELDKFQITSTDMPKLENFTDIYGSVLSNGAAGAAVGAAAFAFGSVETATALGATVTPLAAIAAPVVVFTAIGALAEADENLSKAMKSCAEAKAAVEKMQFDKLKETL